MNLVPFAIDLVDSQLILTTIARPSSSPVPPTAPMSQEDPPPGEPQKSPRDPIRSLARDAKIDALGRELLCTPPALSQKVQRAQLTKTLLVRCHEVTKEWTESEACLLPDGILTGTAFEEALLKCEQDPVLQLSAAFKQALPKAAAMLRGMREWIDENLARSCGASVEELAFSAALVEASEALPQNQRHIAYLFHGNRREVEEIALELGIEEEQIEEVLDEVLRKAKSRARFFVKQYSGNGATRRRPQ